jgi:anti-sigma factor ChrR (cupin superfamily)
MNNILFCALAGELTPQSPSENLRARVLASISQRPTRLLQAEEGEFLPILKGVAVKRLRADAHTETAIWRLDAGATIPAHGHAHEEECLVLGGTIQYAGRTLGTGDYLGAAVGEHQSEIFSPGGALLLIRGELRQ